MSAQVTSDYVIVGAGSAGCALAYRLAEAGHSVLVVEFGGSDRGPLIQMPAALSIPMNMARYDWGYVSEPEPHLGGRQLASPRGKVVGGSSSINGMVYVRGHAHDFDHWAELGATGWGYADVLPYYQRMETWHGRPGEEDDGWRGTDGPVHISRAARDNLLFDAFQAAGAEAGYAVTDDYNGARQEGFGAMERTVWRGQRWSAANAYLKPVLQGSRVRLVTGLARRVIFEGDRAVGVEIDGLSGVETVRARAEVILSASAFNSPKLLMLSGIGPGAHLQSNGIEVRADRPGVGANLMDHFEVYIQVRTRRDVSLNRYWNPLAKAVIGARWALTRTGLGASNQFGAAGFIRSRAGISYPDIQFHFLPIAVRYDGKAQAGAHGFQVHVGPMRSKSRGSVTLRDGDPATAPVIRYNAMSHPEDWTDFRQALRLTREILGQPALAPFSRGELSPGDTQTDDAALDAHVRDTAESAYHPCGTCRMGAGDDPMAVVDPDCRVIGVDGLRVVDSAIFPGIPNGNLNAPSMMVGEKAADLILGRTPLPPSNRVPELAADWETTQRSAEVYSTR